MNVFISWSKDYSKAVASVFRKWIKQVLQQTNPFMSESDIDLGTVPLSEIDINLQKANVGIVIVTKENKNSPWINYESGAIATALDGNNKLIPILIGVTIDELGTVPLSKFQAAKEFSQEEMYKLIKSLNEELGDNKLPNDALLETFELWWPRLEEQISEIKVPRKTEQTGDYNIKENFQDVKMEDIYFITKRNTKVLEDLSMRINDSLVYNKRNATNHTGFNDYSNHLRYMNRELNKINSQLFSILEVKKNMDLDETVDLDELIVIMNNLKKLEYETAELYKLRTSKKYNL